MFAELKHRIISDDEFDTAMAQHGYDGVYPQYHLATDEIVWRLGGPEDDREARLRTQIKIDTLILQVTAFAVLYEVDTFNEQSGEYDMHTSTDRNGATRITFADAEAGAFLNLFEIDSDIDTLLINQRPYAVFAHPISL